MSSRFHFFCFLYICFLFVKHSTCPLTVIVNIFFVVELGQQKAHFTNSTQWSALCDGDVLFLYLFFTKSFNKTK